MRTLLVHRLGWAVFLLGSHSVCIAQDRADGSTLDASGAFVGEVGDFGQLAPGPVLQPETRYSLGETLYKSMFGAQPDPERTWTPLTLDHFTEGWFDPWIAPPQPPGGSRRQGWIASNDAFFNRMIVGIDSVTPGQSGRPRENVASLLFETPVTRRYMFGVLIPFTDNLSSGTAPGLTAFGDTTFENRFMLHETEETSISFNLNDRTPTGDALLGGHR